MVRPANQPSTGIIAWKAPKDKETRNICQKDKVFPEILLLRATAKQSADKATAISKTATKPVLDTYLVWHGLIAADKSPCL